MKITKKGQVLIAAVFVMVIIAVLGLIAASVISTESYSVVKKLQGIQALNIAEGGIRLTVATSLAATSNLSQEVNYGPINLGAGSFLVKFSNKTTNQCDVQVIGTVGGISRTVWITFSNLSGLQAIAQNYAVYMGGNGSGGGATLNGNTTIHGDVFAQNLLTTGGNATIWGDVSSTGNITGTGTIHGTTDPNAPQPSNVPVVNTSYYDAQLAIAASGVSSITLGGITTYPLPATTYIHGNFTTSGIITLTATGPAMIVATGTVNIGSITTLPNNLTIIAGGKITLGGNCSRGNNDLFYSSTNIEVGGNNVGSPKANAFITPGVLTVDGNVNIDGLIYGGTSVTLSGNNNITGLVLGNNVNIGANSNLTLSPSSMNYNGIPGFTPTASSSAGISNWHEGY